MWKYLFAAALAAAIAYVAYYVLSDIRAPESMWNAPPCWKTQAWKYRRWQWRPWMSPHVDAWYKDEHPNAWLKFPWCLPYCTMPNY